MSYYTLVLDDGSELALDGTTGLILQRIQGHGMPPIKTIASEYALRDGGVFQRQKALARTVTLQIAVTDADECGLRAFRLKLIQAISPHRTQLPITLRYYDGKGGKRELCCYYDSGLEGSWETPYNTEIIMLRLISFNPYWRSGTTVNAVLNLQDILANLDYIYARPTIGGAWDTMGGGADNAVADIVVDPVTGNVYACGEFHNIGGVAAAHIAMWDGTTWSALGAGCTSDVIQMVLTPNGKLIAVSNTAGNFAGASTPIGIWDGANWAAFGAAAPDSFVWCVDIDQQGYVWVGGQFTTIGGVACNRIAFYDGGDWVYPVPGAPAWQPCAGGITSGQVNDIGIAPNGDVYVVGTFLNVDGNVYRRIAMWDGAAWHPVGGDVNGAPRKVVAASNGDIYIIGSFTDCAGVTVSNVAKWNGSAWSAMGAGLNGQGYSLAIHQNGDIYVGGTFTQAGGLPVTQGLAIWRNGIWTTGDAGGSISAAYIGEIAFSIDYSTVYIGGDFTEAAFPYPGIQTINNPGTSIAYPIFAMYGPGRLYFIRNSTTGKVIYFNLELQSGELLTIDLSPGVKTVTTSFRGNVISSVYAGDLLTWGLVPGDNLITIYVDDATATGVYSFVPLYWSLD